MSYDRDLRAGTSIFFKKRGTDGTVMLNGLPDVFLIYPAFHRRYIAISLNTSKVGEGDSYGEAYVNLVYGIACAIRIRCTTTQNVNIGKKACRKYWRRATKAHRIPEEEQLHLLEDVLHQFWGRRDFVRLDDATISADKLADTPPKGVLSRLVVGAQDELSILFQNSDPGAETAFLA